MKKQSNSSSCSAFIGLAVVLAAVAAGFSIGCFYRCQKTSVALVDVPMVVNSSTQVQQLQAEQIANAEALTAWLQEAQATVQNEKDEKKQNALVQQYDAELIAKRDAIRADYAQKLQVINDNITGIITEAAQKKGYKLVIAKGVTISGGDDITEEILKAIK